MKSTSTCSCISVTPSAAALMGPVTVSIVVARRRLAAGARAATTGAGAQAPVASPSAPVNHARRDSVVVTPLTYSTINW